MTAQIAVDFCHLCAAHSLSVKTSASLAARTEAWDSTACLGRASISGRRSRLFGFQRKPQTIRGISFLLAGGDSGFSLHLSPAAGLCSSTTSSRRSTCWCTSSLLKQRWLIMVQEVLTFQTVSFGMVSVKPERVETRFWMVARGP